MTEYEFEIIDDAIGDYCMRCSEDTLNDDTICDKCHIRKFMYYVDNAYERKN